MANMTNDRVDAGTPTPPAPEPEMPGTCKCPKCGTALTLQEAAPEMPETSGPGAAEAGGDLIGSISKKYG